VIRTDSQPGKCLLASQFKFKIYKTIEHVVYELAMYKVSKDSKKLEKITRHSACQRNH